MNEINWDATGLGLYLKYENWIVRNGLAVIAGLKYDSPDEKVHFRKTMQEKSPSTSDTKKYDGLCDLWGHSSHPDEVYLTNNTRPLDRKCSLTYIVDWAASKDYRPDWLDWAIEGNLYRSKQEAEKPWQSQVSPTYTSPWLDIQQATIAQFFNPRRNPDAKRDEVVEWIKQQAENAGLPDSENIAKKIFTIIKPINHDPKRKRVEPLD